MRRAYAAALLVLQGAASMYVLEEAYVGMEFFQKFRFFNDTDPSKGTVEYVDYVGAVRNRLISGNDEEVYMGVDMESVLPQDSKIGRKSVRLQSLKTYDGGLFVISIRHMPTGCAVWPAFWMYGEDAANEWPKLGEYDMIEGINNDAFVKTTMHTDAGCDQSQVKEGSDFDSTWFRTNGRATDNCYVRAPGQYFNQGCSQEGPAGSFGVSLNSGGGGTFVGEWDPDEGRIQTWFFRKGEEPRDLRSGAPRPDRWGKPYSFFSLAEDTCPARHFQSMRMVFSLNLCGDLAGSHFPTGCPDLAERMTCEELVLEHPELLREAYWLVSALDVYQKLPDLPVSAPADSAASFSAGAVAAAAKAQGEAQPWEAPPPEARAPPPPRWTQPIGRTQAPSGRSVPLGAALPPPGRPRRRQSASASQDVGDARAAALRALHPNRAAEEPAWMRPPPIERRPPPPPWKPRGASDRQAPEPPWQKPVAGFERAAAAEASVLVSAAHSRALARDRLAAMREGRGRLASFGLAALGVALVGASVLLSVAAASKRAWLLRQQCRMARSLEVPSLEMLLQSDVPAEERPDLQEGDRMITRRDLRRPPPKKLWPFAGGLFGAPPAAGGDARRQAAKEALRQLGPGNGGGGAM